MTAKPLPDSGPPPCSGSGTVSHSPGGSLPEKADADAKSARTSWVAPPKQARSRQRLERILDSALKLMAQKGFRHITVSEIVRHAGTSIGIFYQRFRTKENLLRCLMDRLLRESIHKLEAGLDPTHWRERPVRLMVKEFIHQLVTLYRQQRVLLKTVYREADGDPDLAAMIQEMEGAIDRSLSSLVAERTTELGHPQPMLASRLALRMLIGYLNDQVRFENPTGTAMALDDDGLEAELIRAMSAILQVLEGPSDSMATGTMAKGSREP